MFPAAESSSRMLPPQIVGFSGNATRPSKTRAFVSHVAEQLSRRCAMSHSTFDLADLGPSFRTANSSRDLEMEAAGVVHAISAASILVVGSPTYKGSYSGLFKHFFDLVDPAAIRGKPVILTATGGGERHALVVEHQLRPLFGFFEAATVSTAIYAVESDFVGGVLRSPGVLDRIERAVGEAARHIGQPAIHAVAAE